MNKKIILTISGIALVFVIGIVSYFLVNQNSSVPVQSDKEFAQQNKNNEQSNNDPNNDNLKNQKVKTFDEAQAEEKPESKIKSNDSTVSIEGYTKEEIEDAGEFVLQYIHEAHANTYFLGGEWDKQGNDISILKNFLGRYYAPEVLNELDKYKDDTQNQEFAEKVSGMLPYFGENENYSPSKFCALDNNASEDIKKLEKTGGNLVDKIVNCPIDMNISEIKYQSAKNDKGDYELNMYFTTKTVYPLFSKELQKDAKVTATYKYMLSLTKLLDGKSDSLGWEINGYNVDVEYSKIETL